MRTGVRYGLVFLSGACLAGAIFAREYMHLVSTRSQQQQTIDQLQSRASADRQKMHELELEIASAWRHIHQKADKIDNAGAAYRHSDALDTRLAK
jgi:hypothetical protein